MAKRAISVTLDSDNLAWLRGRAGAGGNSISALLDQIVATARQQGQVVPARSVVGTVEIAGADPMLDTADAAVNAIFAESLGRPTIARERPATYRVTRPHKRRG